MGKGKRIVPVTERIFLDIHCTQKAYKKKYRSGVLWKWWDVVLQKRKGVWTCHVYCKEFLTPFHPYEKKNLNIHEATSPSCWLLFLSEIRKTSNLYIGTTKPEIFSRAVPMWPERNFSPPFLVVWPLLMNASPVLLSEIKIGFPFPLHIYTHKKHKSTDSYRGLRKRTDIGLSFLEKVVTWVKGEKLLESKCVITVPWKPQKIGFIVRILI